MHSGRTVVGDVACGWWVYAERVEAVAVEACFDNVAGARVDVFRHAVEMNLPDEFVGPSVRGEVEVLGLAASGVADRSALVAWRCEEILAGDEGGEILAVLHARPDDEDVGIGLMDGVCAGCHVADKCVPVVVEVGPVVGFAQLVAEGHADDVGVVRGPFGDVGKAAPPVGCVEVVVVEPGVAIGVGAAPLCLSNVHVRADKDAFGSGNASDIAPDLEASGLRSPTWVFLNDLVGDFSTVDVSKGIDHGDLERHIFAVAIVDLVDHLDGVAHADVIPANALDVIENLFCRSPFQAFGNHSLSCSTVSIAPFEIVLCIPDMGQLTPAHVIFSPLAFTMSLPCVLYGPLNAPEVPFPTCLRALYRNDTSASTAGRYPADTTAPAKAEVIIAFKPNILTTKLLISRACRQFRAAHRTF